MNRIFGYALNNPDGERAPLATVNVYLARTLTPATLYADELGNVPLGNPFLADVNAYYEFYVVAARVDVQFSGVGIDLPFTLGDVYVLPQVPANTFANFPVASATDIGTLQLRTDGPRGLYYDDGASWRALNQNIYVEDFGAVGDGVTNDSAAFQAAIAALPVTGGTVICANGPYAINILINRPKVTLQGSHVGRPTNSNLVGGLVPFDITQPVVQLSNDSQLNEAVQLQNLEINGRGTGYYGLVLQGGAYTNFFNNVTIQNFVKKCLWVQSGTSFPCAYLMFDGIAIQPSILANEHAIYIQQGNVAQYAEAIFFNNLRVSGVSFGYALENAGSLSLTLTNTYLQVVNGHGVLLSKPFATKALLFCNGVQIDSPSTNDTLVAQNYETTGNPIEDYIIGQCNLDGKFDSNGTLIPNIGAFMHNPDRTLTIEPRSWGHHSFVDSAGLSSTATYMYGETVAGRLNNVAPNELNMLSGIGVLQNYADTLAIVQNKIRNSSGFHIRRATGLNTEFEPPATGMNVFKANINAFGSATGPQIDVTADIFQFNRNTSIPNNNAYRQLSSAAVQTNIAGYNTSDNLFVGQNGTGTFTSIQSTTNVFFAVGGVTRGEFQSGLFRPSVDNSLNMGGASNRWKELFAVSGTINTSDEREKQDISPIDDRVLDAWATIDFISFRWKESVATKNGHARIHHGVIAQRVLEAFAAQGLDATRYGLFCHDQWDQHDVVAGHEEVDEEYIADEAYIIDVPYAIANPDNPDQPWTGVHEETRIRQVMRTRKVMVDRMRTVPAGDRYGVRSDQCLFLEAALQRRTTQRLQAQLTLLLNKSDQS